jgi:DNA-binding beta-propeller fold protein YncE
MACRRWLCGLGTGEVDPVASQREVLRVGAAVLGAVAVLAVVGRVTNPQAPASRSQPTPTTTPAPPQQFPLPERWATAEIEVGHGGGPLVFGAGSLWVGAWRDGQVVRVDPRSNRVVARFPAGGQNPATLAVGAGTIWVVHPDTDEVVRLDPGTGRVAARIKLDPLPIEFGAGDRRFLPSLVAVGAGAGWVATGRGAVARIDLASNRVVEVIKLLPELPAGIAVAGGSVWVAVGGDGVARIEAATNRRLGTIRFDLHAKRVAVGGGAIWVGGPTTDPTVEVAGAVARIDAATGRVREIVPTGLPVGLAAAAGAVLITEPDTVGGRLECIDPKRLPAGMTLQPALGELAVGGGAVWIADRRGSMVYRLDRDRLPC